MVVDDQCATSVEHVYAAGDMTLGPHLVQVAASKGATAGIAAAVSLCGEQGEPASPRPAPDADAQFEATVRLVHGSGIPQQTAAEETCRPGSYRGRGEGGSLLGVPRPIWRRHVRRYDLIVPE